MTAFAPSLRQLRYLVELDAQRHFGKAAANLGVGQSTLSAGIAELERLVGVQLVERTQRSVRFTALGEAFVLRARTVVEASVALTEFAAAAQPLSGALHLGIIPTIAPFLLPRMLGPIRAAFPSLTLSIREATSATACTALHRGTLDCVLLALPYDCGRVDVAEVLRERLLLGVPAASEPTATPDPATLLLLEDGHCLNEHGLIGCGITRRREPAMVATSIHTLVEMVDAGLGSTFLPQMAIDAGLAEGRRIRIVPLGPAAERRIVLAWRKGSAQAVEFRLLGTAMTRAIAG